MKGQVDEISAKYCLENNGREKYSFSNKMIII